MFLAKKLNRGAGTPAAPTDAQFNYVTMLLHGDGTNGAQNNTFLDSSTNNFTITRNGNTTQGSFSPYGSNWSNFFDGNGDYLYNYTTTTPYAFGQDNFTLEAWVNFASTSGAQGIADSENTTGTGTQSDRWFFQKSSGGDLQFGRHNVGVVASGTWSPVVGTWYHIVACRSSTTLKLFINGSQVASVTDSTDYQADGIQIGVAATPVWFNGYISNFRAVKGTALYTSSFTPSTTPLTAVTNTSVLTCQSNRFIDNSTNNVTFTTSGTPSVQRFNPFGASTAYSTSVIGGSAYFDGTGDYLSVPTGTALNLNTGNFTVEGWVYTTGSQSYYTIFSNGDYPSTAQILLMVSAGYAPFLYMSDGTNWIVSLSSSIFINLDSWNHIAVTASGTTYTIWVNGVSGGSTTSSFTRTSPASTSVVGRLYVSTDDYYAKGYITNVRVVKGTALYTTTFTPPTAPLTAVTNTQLLLNTTNGAIFDNAMMTDLETVGNAQISTSVKKYGTGSIYFDSSGDALYSKSQSVTFGTGDFTLEFWINFNAVNNSTVKFIYDMRNSGATSASFLAQEAGNTWTYWNGAGTSISSGFTSSTFTDSTWTHVAICRSSGTTRFFAGGTLTNSVADTSNYANSTLTFGARYSISDFLNAWIDDVRITKGYARYTATFTPPTAAFLDIGP